MRTLKRARVGDQPSRKEVAKAVAQVVARRPRGRWSGNPEELKFFDTALSFTVDNTAEIPVTGQLALIPQGDTQSSRDGNKAFVKSIYVHGIMYFAPGAATSAATVVYMYLVQDTQANGAAATVADANSGIFTNANLALAARTIVNTERFRVLKAWTVEMNSQAGVSGAFNGLMKAFSFYKTCDIPLLFDASAADGSLPTIRTNNIFLVAGTGGLNDDEVTVNGLCRLRFSDRS